MDESERGKRHLTSPPGLLRILYLSYSAAKTCKKSCIFTTFLITPTSFILEDYLANCLPAGLSNTTDPILLNKENVDTVLS